jgi:hypothetical protein
MAHRFCHEHPAEANNETGNATRFNLFDIPSTKARQKVSALTDSIETSPAWEGVKSLYFRRNSKHFMEPQRPMYIDQLSTVYILKLA